MMSFVCSFPFPIVYPAAAVVVVVVVVLVVLVVVVLSDVHRF
jgi:hypothetical protein